LYELKISSRPHRKRDEVLMKQTSRKHEENISSLAHPGSDEP
jgi:hypothetical protein